jgi:hypothetical protein
MYKCSTVGSGVKNKLRGLPQVGRNKRTVALWQIAAALSAVRPEFSLTTRRAFRTLDTGRKPRGSQSTDPFESHFFPKIRNRK